MVIYLFYLFSVNIKPPRHRFGFSLAWGWQYNGEDLQNVKSETLINLVSRLDRKDVDGKYPCGQCQYKSTTNQNLQFHIRSQHVGFKIVCEYCDKKFTHPSNLRKHTKTIHSIV